MSRFLVAMGERLDVVSQHFLTPVVLKDPLNEWHTVGGRQLEFYLHGPATALFTYGLPVTQASIDKLMLQAIMYVRGERREWTLPPQFCRGNVCPVEADRNIPGQA